MNVHANRCSFVGFKAPRNPYDPKQFKIICVYHSCLNDIGIATVCCNTVIHNKLYVYIEGFHFANLIVCFLFSL